MTTRILFICKGNICRSPTAEAVTRGLLERLGLEDEFELDSAGTHAYYVGKPPDIKAALAAAQRGYDMSRRRGRQVEIRDYDYYDLILAMDRDNLSQLQDCCPPDGQRKLRLFLEFARRHSEDEVPDPYRGGADGFERVIDLIEDAAQGLIESLRGR